MKTVHILILVTTCISFYGLVGVSYFVDAEITDDKMPQVLLQIQHRDSEGKLISYIEGTKIVFIKPDKLDEFLDKLPNKKIIEKDGKQFERFQWIGPDEKFNTVHSYSGYELRVLPVNGKYPTVMMILHNAYQTTPGDTATIRWTILRHLD